MPLLRVRTEIDDRPGRLAVLTGALAALGANILDLSVQVDTDGVVDEFVVDGASAESLEEAVAAAGGRRTAVVAAAPHELIDEPSRALMLAARLRASPRALPEVLTELLRADEAVWVAGPAALADAPPALTVLVGHLRGVRLFREGLPFTLTEAARANALVRSVRPAGGPAPSRQRITLRDGTEVLVRPMTVQDAGPVRAMHERCSQESRRLRYFSVKARIPRRLIEVFCDRTHGVTVVAEGPDGSVLALAHLMYTLDPGVGELAFLVEDAWQGRGLGAALAGRLTRTAREQGLTELRATVLAENTPMRALLTTLGGRTRRTTDPGVLEARISLAVGEHRGGGAAVRVGGEG